MRKPQVVPAGPRAGVLGSESPCFKFGPVDEIVLEDSSLIPRGLGGHCPEGVSDVEWSGKQPARTEGPLV